MQATYVAQEESLFNLIKKEMMGFTAYFSFLGVYFIILKVTL
jgi:hypothetical protein